MENHYISNESLNYCGDVSNSPDSLSILDMKTKIPDPLSLFEKLTLLRTKISSETDSTVEDNLCPNGLMNNVIMNPLHSSDAIDLDLSGTEFVEIEQDGDREIDTDIFKQYKFVNFNEEISENEERALGKCFGAFSISSYSESDTETTYESASIRDYVKKDETPNENEWDDEEFYKTDEESLTDKEHTKIKDDLNINGSFLEIDEMKEYVSEKELGYMECNTNNNSEHLNSNSNYCSDNALDNHEYETVAFDNKKLNSENQNTIGEPDNNNNSRIEGSAPNDLLPQEKDSLESFSLSQIHSKYRVFSGGKFEVPPEDIVTNQKTLSMIINRELLNYLENEVDFRMPSRLQAHMLPVISRGQNAICIGEKKCGKSLGYILPLISLLLDMWPCIEHEASDRVGAVAVIVCKGWVAAKSVSATFSDLLLNTKLRVVGAWGGLGNDQDNETHKRLCSGADIFITTLPFILRLEGLGSSSSENISNLKLLSHCFHLVLDDADVILDYDASGVKSLLKRWTESRSLVHLQHFSQQLIVTASSWTDHIESLSSFLCPLLEPALIISSPFEASRANSVQSHVHYLAQGSRNELLEKAVNLVKDTYTDGNVIIFTQNSSEARKLCALFYSVAVNTRMVNSRMLRWQIQDEIKDWNSSGRGKVLVTTVHALPKLLCENLTDAEVIIHLDIPQQKNKFCERFSFMISQFTVCSDNHNCVLHSHIFYREGEKLPRYLKKCLVQLNTQWHDIENPIFDENYDSKIPLCHILKAFGTCLDVHQCIWRHIVLSEDKICNLPDSGIVTVKKVKILNASRYLVHIQEYRSTDNSIIVDTRNCYFTLFMMLQRYCDENVLTPITTGYSIGSLCLVRNDSIWARARILRSYEGVHSLFLLDEGDEVNFNIDEIYNLPEVFGNLPQLVIEVYLSNICPVDNDTEWTNHANIFAEKLFNNTEDNSKFSGNIVLSLATTLWLSPIVNLIKVEKKWIRGESIRSSLVRQGFGNDNPTHIESLKTLISPVNEPDDCTPWLGHWDNNEDTSD